MSELRLYLFGPPRLERQGTVLEVRRRKVIALAAYLAVSAQPHTRAALTTLFWPEANPRSARANLRGELFRLRRWLGAEVVQAKHAQVTIASPSELWIDVNQFQDCLDQRQAHAHASKQACPDCIPLLTKAVTLYQDGFLAGFTISGSPAFDEWQFFQAETLRQQVTGALQHLINHYTTEDSVDIAIPFARRLLALDSLHESAHRQLMRLYADAGQQSAALRQYDLCVATLESELDVPPDTATTALYEQIRAGSFGKTARQIKSASAPEQAEAERVPPPREEPARPAEQSETPRRHPLPAQTTPFVGRASELAALARLLTDPAVPLITILGVGGMGKTRLAQVAAAAHRELFADGVCYVPLAAVTNAETVVTAIGESLEFIFTGGDRPRQQLLHYLQQKSLLLVLDNFEHLTTAVEMIAGILQQAPTVKVLVTSRERLKLHNEQLFPLTGVDYPTVELNTQDRALALKEWSSYAAVVLFTQSAQRVQPDFALTTENALAVARICQLIQGMPLAILLAATWVTVLTPDEIVIELERELDFLTTDLRDIPERQQSLRALFDHSWHLLTEAEQRVFQQLAIFRGGFSRQAAQDVTGASLQLLMNLVNKSLLYRTEGGRYEVHELLRQYAAEKLRAEPAAHAAVRRDHGRYYCRALQRWDKLFKGPQQKRVLAELEEEIGNVRASWQWAVEQEQVNALKQALPTLWFFYEVRGWFQEGQESFALAAERLRNSHEAAGITDEKALVRALALGHQGWFCYRLGLHRQAETKGQESLGILRDLLRESTLDARHALTIPLHLLGNLARIQGYLERAKELLEEGRLHAEATGNRWEVAKICIALSVVESGMGYHQRASALLQTTLAIGRDLDDAWLMGFALGELGKVTEVTGAYSEARVFYLEALALRQEMNDPFGIAWSSLGLARMAYELGEYATANYMARETVSRFNKMGNQLGEMQARTTLGSVAAASSDHDAAKTHFHNVLQMAHTAEAAPNALEALTGLALCELACGAIPRAVELLTFVQDHPQSTQPLIEQVETELASVAIKLGTDELTRLQKVSQQWDLWTLCTTLTAPDLL